VVVVSNSSPLIAFADIGQLDLLPSIFGSILIPPSVAAEIAPTIAELPPWLSVTALKQTIPAILVHRSLGAGEREALALAIEARAERVVLDDLPARRIARLLSLPVTGTIGVLLAAKRHGLIVSVRPHLDALVRESFFVGAGLYEEVLNLAGEGLRGE
jgi:predicted nucleic acid-binding protein